MVLLPQPGAQYLGRVVGSPQRLIDRFGSMQDISGSVADQIGELGDLRL